jgi:hypothetical protein
LRQKNTELHVGKPFSLDDVRRVVGKALQARA